MFNKKFFKKSFQNFLSVPQKSQGMAIVISITILGLFLVLFRMKSIEQDYLYGQFLKSIEQESTDGKELKAKRARLLSVKNLRRYAEQFNLKEPRPEQIIIIP